MILHIDGRLVEAVLPNWEPRTWAKKNGHLGEGKPVHFSIAGL